MCPQVTNAKHYEAYQLISRLKAIRSIEDSRVRNAEFQVWERDFNGFQTNIELRNVS
jgi:hypothetical protein